MTPIEHYIEGLSDCLKAAQANLASLRAEFDKDPAFHSHGYRFAGHVEDLVDHTRRVMLPTASAHYRAEKSGVLVDAAIDIEVAAFEAYAGHPDEESTIGIQLDTLADDFRAAADRYRRQMWALIQGDQG